jgi:hypothetical protein
MNVTIERINNTGMRFIPKGVIGRTGKVVGKVKHHGREWIRVVFPQKSHSLSHMCFGNEYYDFLEDEIKEQSN